MKIKRILGIMLGVTIFGCMSVNAAEPVKIPLWPNGAPTKNGHEGTQEVWDGPKVSQISEPELWIYKAKKPNGQAVFVAPGGGYKLLSTENEGKLFIDWMNSRGITFAILKYRTPNGHANVPLEDGQRAIELMRQHASEFGYNPNEVGVMGCSAGGHFAATLATMFEDEKYRPDFQILLYPVISMTDLTHKGSRTHLLGENPTQQQIEKYSLENRVTPRTPEAFIVLATDDKTVDPLNSLHYAEALQKNGVKYSLHVYPTGGHGFGFRDTNVYKLQWSGELDRFLRTLEKQK